MLNVQYTGLFNIVLESFRKLGGSASSADIAALVAKRLRLTKAELNERFPGGTTRFHRELSWTRFYLAATGFLECPERRVWSLTAKGWTASFTDAQVQQIVQLHTKADMMLWGKNDEI